MISAFPAVVTSGLTAGYGNLLLVNAASGPVVITLPRPSVGLAPIIVRKTDASTNAVNVNGVAGALVDGAIGAALGSRYDTVELVGDGTNWQVISAVGWSGAGASPTFTTAVLSVSANPAIVGTAVVLTATVIPSMATGVIAFFEGATLLGSSLLSAGTATLNVSPAVGTHSLHADYEGDGGHLGSTSNTVVLSVIASPAPPVAGVGGAVGARVNLPFRIAERAL